MLLWPIASRSTGTDECRRFCNRGVGAIARSSRKEFTAKLKLEDIDYKRLDILARFLNPIGKIDAARRSGANRKQQARIVRSIKRARYLGLLPYNINDTR